jgi:hypothetical protein
MTLSFHGAAVQLPSTVAFERAPVGRLRRSLIKAFAGCRQCGLRMKRVCCSNSDVACAPIQAGREAGQRIAPSVPYSL